MASVSFSQKGAKTAVGFLTTDTNPPRTVFPRRNLPTSEDLNPGDYVFTCEATDMVGAVVTVTVGGDASASKKGTITGDPGTEQTEPIDVEFSVAAGLRASKLSAKVTDRIAETFSNKAAASKGKASEKPRTSGAGKKRKLKSVRSRPKRTTKAKRTHARKSKKK